MCTQSHVHSHMLHHMVGHLTGHMTHHMIHHMISWHNIGHVTWCHGLEGSRKVWNDDSELLLICSSISHPMTSCTASWLILWCHAQPQQVINRVRSVITANCSSRRTQVQTVARSIQSLKKPSQCFAVLGRLTWHKSNKLPNNLKIIYIIV